MTWDELPDDYRHAAETVLTDRQLEVLRLAHDGLGYKRISLVTGLAISTVRSHMEAARRKVAAELERRRNAA